MLHGNASNIDSFSTLQNLAAANCLCQDKFYRRYSIGYSFSMIKDHSFVKQNKFLCFIVDNNLNDNIGYKLLKIVLFLKQRVYQLSSDDYLTSHDYTGY